MATVTKTFAFLNDTEGYVGNPATANISMVHDPAVGNPAGSLRAGTGNKNVVAAESFWEYTGTWESLGVPAGATVTSVRLMGASTRCSTRTSHATSTVIGPYRIHDAAGNQIGVLWSGRTATTQETGWTTTAAQTAVSIPSGSQASTDTVRIRLADTIATGAGGGTANVQMHDDQVSIEITYTEPPTVVPIAASDTVSLSISDTASMTQESVVSVSDTIDIAVSDVASVQEQQAPAGPSWGIVQSAGSGSQTANPTVTFMNPPTPGNLIILVHADRSGGTSATVTAGTGFIRQIHHVELPSDTTWRKYLAVFYKVAGQNEPMTYTTTSTTNGVLMAVELTGVGTPVLRGSASAGNNSDTSVSQTTGNTADITQTPLLLIASAFGKQDGVAPGELRTFNGATWTNGFTSVAERDGPSNDIDLAVAIAEHQTGGVKETTVTTAVAHGRGHINSILAFEIVTSSPSTPVTASDTIDLSVTEEVSLFKTISVTDDIALSVTESTESFRTMTTSDSAVLSIAETTAQEKAFEATDSIALSVTESTEFYRELTADDTSNLAVTETTDILTVAEIVAADAVTLAISEDTTGYVEASADDAVALSVTEDTEFFRTIEVNDSIALSVTESADTFWNAPGQDSVILSVTETTAIEISGTIEVSASDSVQLAVTETVEQAVEIAASDSITLTATETSGIIGVNELSASDSVILSVTESIDVQESDSKTASDSIALAVTDEAFLLKEISVSDTVTLDVTEATGFTKEFSASDSVVLSTTEDTGSDLFVEAADTVTLDVTEDTEFFKDIDVEDLVVIDVAEGTAMHNEVLIFADDAIDLGVVEAAVINTAALQPARVKVYHQGQWVPGVIKIYQNGVWKEVPVKVFRDSGTWF